MTMTCETDLADDMLYGAKAIGAAVGRTERQAFHMLEKGQLPGFKWGGVWAARRSRLRQSVLDREAAANRGEVA